MSATFSSWKQLTIASSFSMFCINSSPQARQRLCKPLHASATSSAGTNPYMHSVRGSNITCILLTQHMCTWLYEWFCGSCLLLHCMCLLMVITFQTFMSNYTRHTPWSLSSQIKTHTQKYSWATEDYVSFLTFSMPSSSSLIPPSFFSIPSTVELTPVTSLYEGSSSGLL